MDDRKTAYKLLGYAVLAELFIASDILITSILTAVTDNIIVQRLVGFLLIYIVWGLGIILISRWSRPLSYSHTVSKPNWIVYLVVFAVTTTLNSLAWGGIKPYIEWTGAVNGLGIGLGIAAFLLQYLYYALEAALMLLILLCGQTAGEKLFAKKAVPYGGIVLAILWGLPHLYTQGLIDGLLVTTYALLYGIAYNAVKGNRKAAYPLIMLITLF